MTLDGMETNYLPKRRQARANGAWLKVIIFLVTFALVAPATADATGEISAYKLAPGDRITVTVVGQTELSGDFPVDQDGNILLPIVGLVEVGNLTLSECRQRVIERLSDGILNRPSVFVRIAELRPLQVLGDVKVPGTYPYRYGTIVKSAIAQAGGFGLAERNPAAAISDFLLADERVRSLDATRRMLLIRQARLEAQLQGAKTFTPPTLPEGIDELDSAKLIAAEIEALATQSEALEKQITLIRSQRPQLLFENEALNGQIKSENDQIGIVEAKLEEYNKLAEKGLGKSSSLMELKLALASKHSNVWRLEAEQSRLRVSIMDFDIRLQDAESLRKKQILSELQELRQHLHDLEVTLPSAREVRALKLQQTGSLVDAGGTGNIKVTRVRGADVSTFDGSETTFLQPGDIVEVRTLRLSNGRSPTAFLKTDDLGKAKKPMAASEPLNESAKD